MTGIFGGRQIKTPTTTPAPPPPTIDEAALKAEQDARDLRRRRGSAATVLSLSDNAKPDVMAKQLLGS